MIEPGTLLQNRYRVATRIGQGGMGAVYVATDERFRSTVAVKQTFFDDPALLRAFEREAILLNRLRHGALPRVSDHFTEGGGQFLVMEFVEGSDFSELLRERGGPFPVADVLRWADDLLDALDYLHGQEPSVVHRDIKPQNLKLTPQGRVVLLDFGLAKGDAGLTRAETTASVFGYSRNYAPLEQIQGTGTDCRSDIYSLAATLYHLLTGRPPADSLTRATAHINNQPDPLRPAHRAHRQVPAQVGDILHRAMALNPALRPRSAAEVRAALRQAAAAPPHATPPRPHAPSTYTRARAASNEATMLDEPAATPAAWQAAPPAHDSARGTTRLHRDSLSQAETALGGQSSDESRRPRGAYFAQDSDATASRPARKLSAPLLVAAAVALLVACVAVPLTLMRQTAAPADSAGTRAEAAGDTSTDDQTGEAGSAEDGGDGATANRASGLDSAPAQGRLAPTPSAGETQSPSAQSANRDPATPDASGVSTGASGSSPEDARALSSGGGASSGSSGLVLQQAAPSSLQANADEEARRIEEQNREQARRQQQAAPPPGGGWQPPPHGRRPPPPPPHGRRFP